MGFITKIDYSDNRQIKQYQLTNTWLSGATCFGVEYSALTKGVDLTTVVTTESTTGVTSTFTGDTGQTTFFFGDVRMELAGGDLVPITDINSGTTQIAGPTFTGNSTTMIDANLVFLDYTGVSYNLIVNQISEVSPGIFSGNTLSDVTILSGITDDYTGSTVWVDVKDSARVRGNLYADFLYGDGSNITNLSGSTNFYTTGTTLIGSTAYFDRTDALSAYTLDLSSFSPTGDTFTTGVTFSDNYLTTSLNDGTTFTTLIDGFTGLTINGTLSATTIDAANILSGGTNLTDIFSTTDNFTTGSTLIGSVAYFDRTDALSAFTLDMSTFVSTGDTFVTGHTFTNNELTSTRNDGGLVSVFINEFTGLTVNGTISATTINGNSILSGGTNLSDIFSTTDNYTTGTTLIGSTAYFDRTNGLSAYTLDLSSFVSTGDTFTTGGTFNDLTDTITFTRNDAVSYSVTGITDTDNFTTGSTLIGTTLYFDRNDALSAYTSDLSTLLDDTNFYVTGGTIIDTSLYLDRTDTLSAVTIDVSSLLDNTDNFTTGSTLIGSVAYFDRTDVLSAFTLDLSSFVSTGDTFVTGHTFTNNELVSTRNDGGVVSVFINEFTGLTVNGTLSATTIDGNSILSGGTNLLDIFSTTDENDFTTGTTLIGTTLYFDRTDSLSAYTADLSSFIDDTDNFTTGSTLIGSTAYFDRTDGLSAYTLDLSSFVATGDTFTTGGTFSDITDEITFTRNDGGAYIVTGITDTNDFTTGTTLVGTTLYYDRTDSLSAYTTDLSSLLDDTNFYVTGGTVIGTSMYLDRTDTLSAVTIDVASLLDNTDNFTTGSTLIGSIAYFDRTDSLSAFTLDLSSFVSTGDTFVTGHTFVNNELISTRNDGGVVSIFINEFTGLTINGTLSATTIDGNSILSGGTNLSDIFSTTDTNDFTSGTTLIGTTLYFDRTDTLSAYTADLSSFIDDTDNFTTGSTLIGSTAYFDRTNGLSAYTLDLSSFVSTGDTFTTGGTFSDITDEITFTRNDGGSYIVTGITDTNDFTTGTTLIGSTLYYDRTNGLSAYTTDLSSFAIDTNDFTTGSTLIGSIAYFDRTDILSAFTLDLSSFVVTGDTFTTGGTFNDITDEITFTRNDGGIYTVTGITDTDNFTTGTTLIGSTLYYDRTDSLSAYTTDLSSLLDDTNFYVTGGTIIGTSMYLDRTDTLSAVTVDVTTLLDNTDNFTTGSTLIGTTAYFDRTDGLSAYTLDLSTLDDNDTFVTGGTFNTGGTLTLTRNDDVDVTVTGITSTPQLAMKTGLVAGVTFTGNPRTSTITFATSFSDNSYSVTVTGEANRNWTVDSKSAAGFTISANSGAAVSGDVFWQAIEIGETT